MFSVNSVYWLSNMSLVLYWVLELEIIKTGFFST